MTSMIRCRRERGISYITSSITDSITVRRPTSPRAEEERLAHDGPQRAVGEPERDPVRPESCLYGPMRESLGLVRMPARAATSRGPALRSLAGGPSARGPFRTGPDAAFEDRTARALGDPARPTKVPSTALRPCPEKRPFKAGVMRPGPSRTVCPLGSGRGTTRASRRGHFGCFDADRRPVRIGPARCRRRPAAGRAFSQTTLAFGYCRGGGQAARRLRRSS